MANKDKISRSTFIKGLAAGAASLATFGILEVADKAGGSSAAKATAKAGASAAGGESVFTPGTYTASAQGMESEVTVSITVDEKSILEASVTADGETKEIGQAAAPTLAQQILDVQSENIDGVSGATRTTDAVRKACENCLAQAKGIDVSLLGSDKEEKVNVDWLGEEPEIAEADIKEKVECDVLVIGAGSSGAFAAAAAAELGAKTILIEKFKHDMASGIRDTFAAVGSSQQKADGHDVDPKKYVRYLRDWSQGYTSPALAKAFVENSGELIDWYTDVLKQGGMDFAHEIDEENPDANYEVMDVGHSVQYTSEYYEQLTLDKVLDYAQGKGLEVRYEVTMVKLIKDGERVCGIIAKNSDDTYSQYNAKGGVIVATGGYSANDDMMNALQPWSVEQTCINYSKSGSKGDGIKACLWAGAAFDNTHSAMIFDRGAVKPDESGKVDDGKLFWMGSQPFLKVNLAGKRFMNEFQPYDYILHTADTQKDHTYITVWDSSWKDDVAQFATHGCSRLIPHANGTLPVFDIPTVEGFNKELLEQGYIVEADSIEELAEKIGVPTDTFTKTVEDYNDIVDAGEDMEFGKEKNHLSKLDAAPFYAARQAGGYLICTLDGIKIDESMRALSTAGDPIEGLYVCGDCSGNYFSGSYPNMLSGCAAGRSATFGRLCGKYAAKEAGF
ncbi:FMN-binding domain-containing protein [Lachnospiraceae bacterium KH1T2]|nr:FMN-binding domain-containing protein [Lachnospiraceae bacterium KH1T2]